MKTSGTLPCAWDCFDAYLFDIDGTLLECKDAVHYFAFCNVLSRIAGRPLTLDGVVAHGNTDTGILRDVFRLAGVAENLWRPRLPGIRRAMCDFVQAREKEVCATVLPNVAQTLEHLRGRGAKLGVATGNLRVIGQIKLRRAGLLSAFDFEGWSDGMETRAEVFRAAAAEARRMAGNQASMCVIGDTPADINAARQNGLSVIAVATGPYSAADLATNSPDLCIESLGELPMLQSLPA